MQLFDNRTTSLASSITTVATSATTADTGLGSPSGVVEAVIDYNSPTSFEKVLMTISGTTLTLLSRGVDNGGVGKTHAAGAPITYALTKEHYDHQLTNTNTGWTSFNPQVILYNALMTFTYVSATSWKASGDWTSTTNVGDAVRLVNNGSTKYGFIVSQVFSAGETTFGWSDGLGGSVTTLSAGTITSPFYSKVNRAAGVPNGASFLTARTGDWTFIGQNFGVTYSRVSNTVLRLLGQNLTAVVGIGDSLRFVNNGTTKYGVVSNVALAGSDTDVTFNAGTDFTLDAGTITEVSMSKVANPVGFPSYFTFNPALTGFSVAPSGGYARFSTVGRLCNVQAWYPTNGTSNSTGKGLTAPFNSVAGATQVINVVDNGTSAYGKWVMNASSSAVTAYPSATVGNWTASGSCTVASDPICFSYRF